MDPNNLAVADDALSHGPAIERIDVSAYTIPTESPESDGTLEWDSTTLVLVQVQAGGRTGIGWSYADVATAKLIEHKLKDVVTGRPAFALAGCWRAMQRSIRNLGSPGIASMGIAAVDNALWDLKARLLELPLVSLLGAARAAVPVYGSGGFTSYSVAELQRQLGGWRDEGIPKVKMKVGRAPADDLARVAAAREAIGPDCELFVDANGGYARKQALTLAERFAALGVSWFEEPVPSDDLDGLRLLRDRVAAPIEISAGEYGYDHFYFRRMLQAGAVDVLQADATRCAGVTGFMQAAELAAAFEVPLSSHCAPALHLHLCCAAAPVRHMEYFFDHVRIERMLFDGVRVPVQGRLAPDPSRPGFGLEFRFADAARYAV